MNSRKTSSAQSQIFFAGNLKRWLDFLDRSGPFARPILQQLELAAGFGIWFAPYQLIAQGGGRKNIKWPDDQKKRLGVQLLLFRQFAGGGVDPKLFAFALMGSSTDTNEGMLDIVNQIFIPTSHELRRFLLDVAQPAPDIAALQPTTGDFDVGPDSGTARPPVLILKPTFGGISIDLMELGQRLRAWLQRR